MKIQTIQFHNFKGRTREIDVGPLNLYVGPNGSGKTGVLLGIRFAVTGETPYGKRPSDAWKMAGPTGCSVTVTLDDGFQWTRSLHRHRRNGTISTELDIAGEEHLGVAESEFVIRERVGAFAPTWTVRETLGMSPDKLRDFMLGLCGANGSRSVLDATVLSERIQRRFLEDGIGVPPDKLSMDQLREDYADAPLLGHASSTVVGAMIGKADPASAMLAGLNAAKDAANTTKAQRDESQAAARQLRDRLAEIEVEADTATDHASELDSVRADIRSVDERIGEARERATSIADAEGRLRGLRGKHRQAVSDLEQVVAVDLCEADAADEEADEAAKWLNHRPWIDPADAEKALADTRRQDNATQRTADESERACTDLSATLASLDKRIEACSADPWMDAVERFDAMIEVLGLPAVAESPRPVGPYSDYRAWLLAKSRSDEKASLFAELERTVEELKQVRLEVIERQTDAKKTNAAVIAAIEAVAAARDRNTSRFGRKTIAQDALNKSLMIRDRHATSESQRKRLAAMVDKVNTEIGEAEEKLHDLHLDGLASGGLDEERSALADRERSILAASKSAERAKALRTELDDVVASCERQGRLHYIYKGLANAVRDIREEIMAEAVRPLIHHVQAFLDAANMGRTAYCDLESSTGRPVFDLGWSDSTTRVPLDALSGGETCIYVSAVAYAMVQLADVPMRLLLIEAAEVDSYHMARLMEAIEITCKEGPQAFLAAHVEPPQWSGAHPWVENHMELEVVA